MKKICTLALLTLAYTLTSASARVIYGVDNRKDVYATKNAAHVKLAKSSAGMIHLAHFTKSATPKAFDLKETDTLERSANICTSEKFADQQVAPTCSGFLVGPDILVTAGHCYKFMDKPEDVCQSFAWVFDYEMKSEKHDPTKAISVDNFYLCKEILSLSDAKSDFAIIKLDRKVVGRKPLKFRESGKVADNAHLMVIGHPTGLPTKISDGGKIINNQSSSMILTNLDTFHGNSGSAVFDAKSGLLEGILIMGKTDYIPSIPSNPESCQVVNKCSADGSNCTSKEKPGETAPGEIVLRIDTIAYLIKLALNPKKN